MVTSFQSATSYLVMDTKFSSKNTDLTNGKWNKAVASGAKVASSIDLNSMD